MPGKQPPLNGAYYGPAVPPPSQTYHRHGHGHRRGCGCFHFTTFLKILVTIIILAGLAVLIIWLVFRPNKVKFHVTDTKLTQFNLTDNQLRYNLALNLTVRNPNNRIGVYYDTIEAAAVYKDQRLQTQWLPPFYQGHKTTAVLAPTFDGQQLLLLAGEGLTQFNAEKVAGVYDIDVELRLRIRLKFGAVRVGKFKPKVGCEFKVPLSTSGGNPVPPVFQTAGCDIDYW
ncbi:NDR1/HIN1-like protein 10 [Momordica charantia]|uniref:NDR1/HIN1-like protein 10 n=1 Tax=Momordica charantia TaxID=3673 RepID=A0A6J1CT55_MOMCH|nr:NDR1/HIN1-like protein 10 [Momordica charantia]